MKTIDNIENKFEASHELPSTIIEQTINLIKDKINGNDETNNVAILVLTALKNRLEIEQRYYMEKAYIVGWDCGWEECGSNYRDKKDEKLITDFETFYNKIKNEQSK
jgi:hypothetical protein